MSASTALSLAFRTPLATALGCVGLFFYADSLYTLARLLVPGGGHG